MKSTYALQHSRKIKIRQESHLKDQPIHSFEYENQCPHPNISKSNFRQAWGISSKSFSGHTNRSPLNFAYFLRNLYRTPPCDGIVSSEAALCVAACGNGFWLWHRKQVAEMARTPWQSCALRSNSLSDCEALLGQQTAPDRDAP
ncbi:hypothetical protein [Vandammella animalimorsus]|uniref:hypothetical protein n=1 Tax=Vandammella animalimorsus TaxID=2029117 RepID=UPI00117DDD0C|nr:hypothetical protein [Vandammella animalimorsus]